MSSEELLFLKIQVFYQTFQNGGYDHPLDLAKALEGLANDAWDEVDAIYPSSIKIEP
ncbi:hypothetical protein NOS3756_53910 [Nostoc sp. NIES-3756]|uniref:hypothetical protein n=1 Tax=Nostoc sp. NIES-3756 TaxID=1751286 RepID=UPI00071F28E9|nr:hypothetical protein [Nostoc sp. NIES-3756]BAT56386.1 hypothetical protein NOS3756_53910 [Nostoc sp. NIES-3756]